MATGPKIVFKKKCAPNPNQLRPDTVATAALKEPVPRKSLV
ncbi:unnamed protein product [Diplocarpon coronariae]